MSVERKHFWQLVRRGCGGVSMPEKYGLSGCMPAVVSRTDGSNVAGTTEAAGSRRCPRDSKYDRKVSRISSEVTARCLAPGYTDRVALALRGATIVAHP